MKTYSRRRLRKEGIALSCRHRSIDLPKRTKQTLVCCIDNNIYFSNVVMSPCLLHRGERAIEDVRGLRNDKDQHRAIAIMISSTEVRDYI